MYGMNYLNDGEYIDTYNKFPMNDSYVDPGLIDYCNYENNFKSFYDDDIKYGNLHNNNYFKNTSKEAIREMINTGGFIDFSGSFLEDQGIVFVTEALHDAKNDISVLDLSDNYILQNGLTAIASALRLNPPLYCLNLQKNTIGNYPHEFKEFADSLKINQYLTKLNMENCSISDDTFMMLCKALQTNNKLQEINLRWNHITDRGAKILIEALSSNHSLINIFLKGNLVSDELLMKIDSVLQSNQTSKFTYDSLENKYKNLSNKLLDLEKVTDQKNKEKLLYDKEIIRLEGEIRKTKYELDNEKEANNEKQQLIDKLSKQLNDAKDNLDLQTDKYLKHAEKSNTTILDYEKEICTLNKTLDDYNIELKAKNKEIDLLNGTIVKYRDDLTTLNNSYVNKKDELLGQNNKLLDEISQLKIKNEALHRKIESEINKTKIELTNLYEDKTIKMDQHYQQSLIENSKKNSEDKQNLEHLYNKQLSDLQLIITKNEEKYKLEYSKLKQTLNDSSLRITEIENDNRSLESRNLDLSNQIDIMQNEKNKLSDTISTLERDISNKSSEICKLNKLISTNEITIHNKDISYNQLKEDYNNMKSQLEQKLSEKESQIKSLEVTLRDTRSDYHSKLEFTEKELERCKSDLHKIKSKYQQSLNIIDQKLTQNIKKSLKDLHTDLNLS